MSHEVAAPPPRFVIHGHVRKGAQNTQARALSRLLMTCQGPPQSEEDQSSCYTVSLESATDTAYDADGEPLWDHGTYLNETSKLESLLLWGHSQEPPFGTYIPIKMNELVREQMRDFFCTTIRARFNGGELFPFHLNDAGYLVRTVENHPQRRIPHSLQSQILQLPYYPKDRWALRDESSVLPYEGIHTESQWRWNATKPSNSDRSVPAAGSYSARMSKGWPFSPQGRP